MTARFEVDYKAIRKLETKMAQMPGKAEAIINDTLHDYGIRETVQDITKLIPISTRNGRIRKKNHARFSNWSRSEEDNLAFTIKARGGAAKRKGSFGYLVFPEEGRGAHNPREQRFAERGLVVAATPKIINKLSENIDKKLQEVLR